MKYNKINKEIYCDGYNYYLPAINRYLLKEWVDSASFFQEGFGMVEKDRKYNYVKPGGTFLLDEWVDEIYEFSEGFGKVKKDGKKYKVDKTGNLYEI